VTLFVGVLIDRVTAARFYELLAPHIERNPDRFTDKERDAFRSMKKCADLERPREVARVVPPCAPGLLTRTVDPVNEIDLKTYAARRQSTPQAQTKRARAGRIPGARQDDRRRWWVPADAS
jgi:hypothetical protein